MEMVRKMVDDRVYPCFEADIPGCGTFSYYFGYELESPKSRHFRMYGYPEELAYYEEADKLSKYARQKIYDYYKKVKAYYEDRGWKVKELKFHRIKKEIYEQEMYATLDELDADPRADEEWR